jgi:hypothetical protein
LEKTSQLDVLTKIPAAAPKEAPFIPAPLKNELDARVLPTPLPPENVRPLIPAAEAPTKPSSKRLAKIKASSSITAPAEDPGFDLTM